ALRGVLGVSRGGCGEQDDQRGAGNQRGPAGHGFPPDPIECCRSTSRRGPGFQGAGARPIWRDRATYSHGGKRCPRGGRGSSLKTFRPPVGGRTLQALEVSDGSSITSLRPGPDPPGGALGAPGGGGGAGGDRQRGQGQGRGDSRPRQGRE